MKARMARKGLEWLTIPVDMPLPADEDPEFGFDPDFVVSDGGEDETQERDVWFEPDPALAAPLRAPR